MVKCLEMQDHKRSADLRKYYIKNVFSKEKGLNKSPIKMQEKWGNIYPIAKAIEFIPMNERGKLLFVCKEWNRLLEKKVIKSLLVKQIKNQQIEKKRIAMWLSIMKYVTFRFFKNF